MWSHHLKVLLYKQKKKLMNFLLGQRVMNPLRLKMGFCCEPSSLVFDRPYN